MRAPSLGRLKFIGKVCRGGTCTPSPRRFDAAKTCKNQCADKPLRPKGASERQFALSRRHSLAVTPSPSRRRNRPNLARPLDDVFSFHFGFSGSPAALENLRWHHAVRGLKLTPVLVGPCCGLVARHAGSGDLLSEHGLCTTSLMRWARHLLSAEELRKRAEHLRNLPQKASKRQQKKKPLKRQKETSAQSLRRAHGQRSGCSSVVLGHACRSDELQRNGACRACCSAGLSPHSLRI